MSWVSRGQLMNLSLKFICKQIETKKIEIGFHLKFRIGLDNEIVNCYDKEKENTHQCVINSFDSFLLFLHIHVTLIWSFSTSSILLGYKQRRLYLKQSYISSVHHPSFFYLTSLGISSAYD